MDNSVRGFTGAITFALGGAMLLFSLYQILYNVDKPWINQELFMVLFVLPIGFVAFLLIGLGILSILKATKSQDVSKVQR
ncbi:MAG: hypothetical protein QXU45_04480 [Candidatus Bathyarchaeia archaeon]